MKKYYVFVSQYKDKDIDLMFDQVIKAKNLKEAKKLFVAPEVDEGDIYIVRESDLHLTQ